LKLFAPYSEVGRREEKKRERRERRRDRSAMKGM
jgi:hypothetical protein